MDRMALDILFCDPGAEVMKFVDDNWLPDQEILAELENADAFEQAIEIKTNNKQCTR